MGTLAVLLDYCNRKSEKATTSCVGSLTFANALIGYEATLASMRVMLNTGSLSFLDHTEPGKLYKGCIITNDELLTAANRALIRPKVKRAGTLRDAAIVSRCFTCWKRCAWRNGYLLRSNQLSTTSVSASSARSWTGKTTKTTKGNASTGRKGRKKSCKNLKL